LLFGRKGGGGPTADPEGGGPPVGCVREVGKRAAEGIPLCEGFLGGWGRAHQDGEGGGNQAANKVIFWGDMKKLSKDPDEIKKGEWHGKWASHERKMILHTA